MVEVPKSETVFDDRREAHIALALTVVVLATLTIVKPLSGIAYIGAVAVTVAAVLQLYLPLWRIDQLKLGHAFIGLTWANWRTDVKLVGLLAAVTFPLYAIGNHLFLTFGHDAVAALGWPEVARFVPRAALRLHWPSSGAGVLDDLGAALQVVATHVLGVALPEETFYRGYLQPRLEALWQPRWRWLGVRIGLGAVVASALFASGHFLGEWNPLRLGPFFPGLVFAWMRNKSGTVMGAIGFHAACNLVSEILSTQYDSG